MNLRNISAWSIRNPVVPIVLFAGLLMAGLLSFNRLDVNINPDIDFPAATIRIAQPGAAPSELETQVTQRVEAAVRAIDGVDQISSTVREGSSFTFVMFDLGVDINEAVNEVRSAIDQIRGELPEGILEPQVQKESGTGDAIAYFAVEAEDMTIEQLSWFVDDTVAKALLGVEGVANIDRGGGVDREIRVILDPMRMQSLGVTASQINNVLRQTNVDSGGGQAEIAGSRQSVRVLGNADTAFELGQRQIQLGNGRTVRLREVATVRDAYGEQTSVGKLRGKEVITFGLERAKGSSEVSVYDAAVAKMRDIEAENSGIKFTNLFTTVNYTKAQYRSAMAAMVEGALLAVVVVFLFLRDWRATFISAIAIPLSAIPTFWFMDLLGFTLNEMTLLALGLVAGVLVDDAIVEIENIVRHMRMGKTAYQASIDAADEIGLAVVATTFSIVAVFLPVGLMPGISGQFFQTFGLTVVIAVLMSLAVARMISPMIAAYFLKAHGQQAHAEGWAMDRYISLLKWTLNRDDSLESVAKNPRAPSRWWYYPIFAILGVAVLGASIFAAVQVFGAMGPLELSNLITVNLALVVFVAIFLGLRWLVRRGVGIPQIGLTQWFSRRMDRNAARAQDHRIWMIGAAVLAFIQTIVFFSVVPVQAFPDTDDDFSRVRIEMVPGTTIEQTEAVADQVAAIIDEQPDVDAALERIRVGNAFIFITLSPDRERTSQDFERDLTPVLQRVPDARVSFLSNSFGGPSSGRDITIMLQGSDPELLNETATQVAEEMKTLDELVAPRVTADLNRPEIIVRPRYDLAAELGVTTSALSQTIRIATIGDIDRNSAKFSLSDRQIPIRVMMPEYSRENLATIENLPVPTASGGSVPLSRVADISFGAGPTTIQRENQNRRVFIGADLAQDVQYGNAFSKVQELPILQNLPTGVSNAPAGMDEITQEIVSNFSVAVVAGVFLVFGVLVLLYRRFVSPLVNMSSLLLAPLGGIMLIWATGHALSIPVFIGVLMLLGIVGKNSILLIDFALEEMESGVPKLNAIIDAGRKRAQPIVMTTVAMTAGMVPVALSLSGDSAFRAPMGVAVIGGLVLSTVLTLAIVPAAFSLAYDVERRLGNFFRRYVLVDNTAAPDADGPKPEVQPAE